MKNNVLIFDANRPSGLPKPDDPSMVLCSIEVTATEVSLWVKSVDSTSEQYNWLVSRICDAIAALLDKKRESANGNRPGAA